MNGPLEANGQRVHVIKSPLQLEEVSVCTTRDVRVVRMKNVLICQKLKGGEWKHDARLEMRDNPPPEDCLGENFDYKAWLRIHAFAIELSQRLQSGIEAKFQEVANRRPA